MTNIPESETALPEMFDPATQEGSKFDLMPVGWYKGQITDASVSQPQSGDGWGVNLTWQITEGDYEGRYVWQWITVTHSSAEATIIGRRQFKDLCVATGIDEQVTDVTVFKYIPCQIRVGVQEDKNGIYNDKNKVSRIRHIDAPVKQPKQSAKSAQSVKSSASATMAPGAATQPTAPAAPAAKPASNAASGANGNVPPWRQAKPSPSQDLDDEVPY